MGSETSSSFSKIVGNNSLSGMPQRIGWSEAGSEGEGVLGAILGPSGAEEGTFDEKVGTKETVDVGDRLVNIKSHGTLQETGQLLKTSWSSMIFSILLHLKQSVPQ